MGGATAASCWLSRRGWGGTFAAGSLATPLSFTLFSRTLRFLSRLAAGKAAVMHYCMYTLTTKSSSSSVSPFCFMVHGKTNPCLPSKWVSLPRIVRYLSLSSFSRGGRIWLLLPVVSLLATASAAARTSSGTATGSCRCGRCGRLASFASLFGRRLLWCGCCSFSTLTSL